MARIRTAARNLLTLDEKSEARIFQGDALLRRMTRLGLLKSIHHARCLIRQRHIRVGKQICDIPSFLVRVDSEKHIDFALTSPFGGGRPGRVRRKRMATKGGDKGGDEEED